MATATRTRALAGAILIRIGDTDTQEVATFEVPVIATLKYTEATVHLEAGDVRGAMATALRSAADRLEADAERDDSDS